MIMVREPSGFVMYMRTPALKTQLPAGKSWLRLDFEKEAAKLGLDFSGILDASQTLGPLQRGLVSTSRLGRETVAGKPTTHYRAVVDVHRAAAALPSYAKQIRAIEKATGTRLGRTTQDVWVGTDGRVRAHPQLHAHGRGGHGGDVRADDDVPRLRRAGVDLRAAARAGLRLQLSRPATASASRSWATTSSRMSSSERSGVQPTALLILSIEGIRWSMSSIPWP